MSVFSQVETGTSWSRTRFTKSLSYVMKYDCRFHEVIPVYWMFCLPGDVTKLAGDVLVRFHPMLSPTLTPNSFKVRYFFVPLRLLEENTELIITGSKNGKMYTEALPTFKNFVDDADKTEDANCFKVAKWSFWDYMSVQCLDYENIKTDECLPAQYWYKAYKRIWFDYYRDENYDTEDDFDVLWEDEKVKGADVNPFFSHLRKDYFTSTLPWQLKAPSAPSIQTTLTTWTPNFTAAAAETGLSSGALNGLVGTFGANSIYAAKVAPTGGVAGKLEPFTSPDANQAGADAFQDRFVNWLNRPQQNSTLVTFNADQLRTMMAQTRIFERLARAGSRYTEYLRANFGTAPADDTLQRAQYLGGWSVPIVTTEVLQTAQGTDPVGTMRGHGITRGGNRIQTFHCKEFGVLFGVAEVRPDVEYTTGIPRELSYKRRWDFFNPSFQHLSEQEVRKGELFVSNSDGENDVTLGFQAYANELRSKSNRTVGDLRDSLSYWNQALHFSTRPEVSGLLDASAHLGSFNAPFVGSGDNRRPIIVQYHNIVDSYRPLVRYATPGLVDHL